MGIVKERTKMDQLLRQIDELKKSLDKKRPFPAAVVRNLRENLLVEWTYNSNAIEGSTLTLSETKVILEDGITIGGKTIREHLEALNHREAIVYLEELLRNGEELTERTIKDIQGIVLSGIHRENAGRYRKTKVVISGAEHMPPDPFLVPEQMHDLIEWHRGPAQKLHPVERAAILKRGGSKPGSESNRWLSGFS